jgi:hypothetical protein
MLALVTHIPPSVWEAEGEQAIVTAYEILEEQADRMKDARR